MKGRALRIMQVIALAIAVFVTVIYLALTSYSQEGDKASIQKAKEFFKKAKSLNQGKPTCPPEVLRQKEFFYRKAIDLHPEYAEAWNNLGDVLENLGKYAKALSAYDKAIFIAPKFAVAYFGKGDVLFRCRRFTEAIDAYNTGLEHSSVSGVPQEDVYLTRQRIKVAQDILSGFSGTKEKVIIPDSVFVEVLDPRDSKGKPLEFRDSDGVGPLPTIELDGRVLPFDYNSAVLLPQAKLQLDQLGKALKSGLAGVSFELGGHTDERGTEEYNLDLSKRRVESVKNYLVDKWKVEPGLLHIRAYGERIPTAPGAKTEAEHATNRRVEIRRLYKEDIPPPNPGKTSFSLRFRILHAKETGGYELIRPYQTTLRSGDYYQIYLHPSIRCYVYLVQKGSSGKVQYLIPSDKVEFSNPLEADTDYWLPSRGKGFRLDETPGEETIYLMATQQPAEDLNYLFRKLDDKTKNGTNVGEEIIDQIKTRGPVPGGVKPVPEVKKPSPPVVVEPRPRPKEKPETREEEFLVEPGGPPIEVTFFHECFITFTDVPSYGSFENLTGRIRCVTPANYKVAVYIYVGGWWTKPYWDNPLTTIQSDGSWTCNITSGGTDQNATRIAAYLVPNGYNPPRMSGAQTLPVTLDQNSIAKVEITREPRR